MPDHRLLPDWLSGYLEYTSAHEALESLHMWTAITLLGMSTRRKIFIAHEYYTIYPNMYVIIVAESARARKSTAMDLGRGIFLDVFPDANVFRDSGTNIGMIKMLNKTVRIVEGTTQNEIRRSDVAIFADEVANLFGHDRARAASMVIFLTRTYGCPDIYDHTTGRDSTIRLHNLFPSLLGGTDPRNLKVLPEDAVGGLTGRLIWIIESTRRNNNPGWKRDNADSTRRHLLREYLLHDLYRIGTLAGECSVDEEAQDYYNKWYEKLSQMETKDPEVDAFYQRCHTTALRLAIILSVSHSDTLEISLGDMRRAVELIELQLPETKRITMWSGNSMYEQQRAKLIHFLQKSPHGMNTRRNALKYMGMSATDFDTILVATLRSDGTLHPPKQVGSEQILALTKEGLGRNGDGSP